MQTIAVSRRTVLVGAVSAAVAPMLGSRASAAERSSPQGVVSSAGKPRYQHSATALLDGRILLAGGYHVGESVRRQTRITPSASVEIYDPSGDSYVEVMPLGVPRARHAAVLLPDGRVAVLGGFLTGELDSVEVFDPRTGLWTPDRPLARPMSDHIACLSGSTIVLSGGRFGTPAETHVLSAASSRTLP